MRRLLLLAACVVAVTGCGAQQAAEDVSEPGAPPEASSANPASTPAATEDAMASEARSDGASITSEASTETVASPDFPGGGEDISYLTDVRTGRHEGFDRVVWAFDGPVPTYRIGYVDLPVTEDGSGDVVQLKGAAALHAIFSPASGVDMSGAELETIYTGPNRIDRAAAGTTAVQEVVGTGDFEATLGWAVGLDAQAPFTVTELSDPARIVVDVVTN